MLGTCSPGACEGEGDFKSPHPHPPDPGCSGCQSSPQFNSRLLCRGRLHPCKVRWEFKPLLFYGYRALCQRSYWVFLWLSRCLQLWQPFTVCCGPEYPSCSQSHLPYTRTTGLSSGFSAGPPRVGSKPSGALLHCSGLFTAYKGLKRG